MAETTHDARCEPHAAWCEARNERLAEYYDQFDTEDLELNLLHATGADREIMLEILEARSR